MKQERKKERNRQNFKAFIVGGKYAGDESLIELMSSFWMRIEKKCLYTQIKMKT